MVNCNGCNRLSSVDRSKFDGICRHEPRRLSSIVSPSVGHDQSGGLTASYLDAIGVFACKHSALQVELARHKSVVKRFTSVQYLHDSRLYNMAVDVLATAENDSKTNNILLGEERYEGIQKLNRI